MGYFEKDLIGDEKILFRTRLHIITIFGHLVVGLCTGLLGLFCLYKFMNDRNDPNGPFQYWEIGAGVLILAGAVIVFLAMMRRNATEIAVTNKRILIKTGLLSRRTLELLLSRVESIVISETFLGRILDYGTVVVRGTGGTPEPFDCIAKPNELRRCVQEQIEAMQGPAFTPGK